ncbi:MAG: hypothetical protein IIZ78_00835 [Clostridiales bacterium]|nr:hypothetical protein [Clostridiales bacterium]
MDERYEMTSEQFMKLVQLSTALMLQDLYEKEVIDNIASELGDLTLEILRLKNEKKRDTL